MSKNSSKEQKALWEARWKAKDPEHVRALARARAKRWRERHPDKQLLVNEKRRAERERGKIKPHLSDEEKQVIEQLYQQGLSFKEISAKVHRTGNTVANYLRTQHEIRVRPVPYGPKHQAWKGGRWKDQHGYWYVRLLPIDPFISMGGKNGIVYEHRLVMARLLNRPLLPTESVHHINGDEGDNRPENLQIRQGKHGKHIVMACLDCGSHRLGPVEITEAAP